MWMKRLTKKQIDDVDKALRSIHDGLEEPKTASKVAAIIQVSPAHLSKHKKGEITPTLWRALVVGGWVTPPKRRVRLSADCASTEQRDACHDLARRRGFTWSQFTQYCATNGRFELEVLETVSRLSGAQDAERQSLVAQLVALSGMMQPTFNTLQRGNDDDDN